MRARRDGITKEDNRLHHAGRRKVTYLRGPTGRALLKKMYRLAGALLHDKPCTLGGYEVEAPPRRTVVQHKVGHSLLVAIVRDQGQSDLVVMRSQCYLRPLLCNNFPHPQYRERFLGEC